MACKYGELCGPSSKKCDETCKEWGGGIMSYWRKIYDREDVELSEDGKFIEVLYDTDKFGNKYIEIPIEFIREVLRDDTTDRD